MSRPRDELARELFIAGNFNQPREQSIVDWQWFMETPRFAVRIERYKAMAEGVIAAGYRKPRQITTVAELDALPVESVIRDECGMVLELDYIVGYPSDKWWSQPGSHLRHDSLYVDLPATVLWEPLP